MGRDVQILSSANIHGSSHQPTDLSIKHKCQFIQASHEKCWDTLTVAVLAASLLDSTPNDVGRASLLATSAKESDAWLLAMPVTELEDG